MSIPFLLNGEHFDAPSWLCQHSPYWTAPEPDQLPLVVDCSIDLFLELISVLETSSWQLCAQPAELERLAVRYQVVLPDRQPFFETAQPILEQNTDQLLESLFLADDGLLQVYSDEPSLQQGVQALICANQVQSLIQQPVEQIEQELLPILSKQKPIHNLLQRRLALMAEQVYQEWEANRADQDLTKRKTVFFKLLGQV